MIIRSLCYFPPVKGNRSESAGRSIRNVLNGFRFRLIAISLTAFFMQSLPLLIPFAFQRYLPVLMEGADLNNARLQALASILALAFAVSAFRSLATFYFLKEAGRTGHQLVASLRELAFAQLMRLPVRYVERRGSGRILLRFIGDTDALRNWFSKTGPKLLADCAAAALISSSLVWLNWRLSMVLVVPLLLTGLVVVTLARSIREKTRVARGRQAQFTGFVQAQLGNIRSSKLADARDPARTELRSRIAEVSMLNADRDRDAAKLEALAEFAIYSSLPLLTLTGLPLVWSNRLAPSEFIIFVWLTLHLLTLLRSSFPAFVIQQKALISIQRIYVLLARSAERGRSTNSVISEFRSLSIFFDGQRYNYGRGIHDVPEGVAHAQLMAAMQGFEQPSEIAITVDEVPIDRIDLALRRRQVGGFPAENAEVGLLASRTELAELKILIVAGKLSALNALEQRQIEQLAERSIILFARRQHTNRALPESLRFDPSETRQVV
jgi:ABC-type multidrug transport system fused ATPase/permease subunit